MRTTLNIDEALLENVVEVTGEKSKSKAVNAALKEFVRRKRVQEMVEYWKTHPFDEERHAEIQRRFAEREERMKSSEH